MLKEEVASTIVVSDRMRTDWLEATAVRGRGGDGREEEKWDFEVTRDGIGQ